MWHDTLPVFSPLHSAMKSMMQDPKSPYHSLLPYMRGVIFDSAPMLPEGPDPSLSPMHQSRLARVIHTLLLPFHVLNRLRLALGEAVAFSLPVTAILLGRAQYTHAFWTPAITAWTFFYKLFLLLSAWVRGSRQGRLDSTNPGLDGRYRMKAALERNVPQVPHQFLYSHGDRLLPAHFVRSYMHFLRTHHSSLPVYAHDFETSGHVQHFLKHTQTYARIIRDFLIRSQQTQKL